MPRAHPRRRRVRMWLVLCALLASALVSTSIPRVSAAEDTEVVKLVGTLRGIGSRYAFFSPDGSKLLTVGKDAARVWDLRTMKPVADAAMKHEAVIEDAGWLADGRRVFTAGGNEVHIWDPLTPKVVTSIRQDVPVKTGCVSPDGKLIVAGNPPGAGMVWDAATGKPLYQLKGPGELLLSRFSADGKRLLTATYKKGQGFFDGSADVRILNPQTGEELVPSNMVNFDKWAHPAFADFSPDGKMFVVADSPSFAVFDVGTGRQLCRGDGWYGPVAVVQFTADSSKLMAAANRTTLYDPRTGKEVWKSAIHSLWPKSKQGAAASPDGSLVFFTAWNDDASVWGMRTGKELQEFGQPGTEAIAVSPDGRLMALAYSLEPTEIWEIVRR